MTPPHLGFSLQYRSELTLTQSFIRRRRSSFAERCTSSSSFPTSIASAISEENFRILPFRCFHRDQHPTPKTVPKAKRIGEESNIVMEAATQKKLRVLCLHGFRTSANILHKLIGRWPDSVLQKLDLVFLDGPFPAQGKSSAEGIYDPPYFEWFQAKDEDFTDFFNFEECLAYIEDYMVKNGPFDGLLGFSQGAVLSAAIPGMQSQGLTLGKVEKIKFLILISGAKFGGNMYAAPKLATNAFSKPIDIPSLHFIGEEDFQKEEGIALLDAFVEPLVIHHPKGHTIPKLDDKGLETMLAFIAKIQSLPSKSSRPGDQGFRF